MTRTHTRWIRGAATQLATFAIATPLVVGVSASPAYADSYRVDTATNTNRIDCDHLYYSSLNSAARFDDDGAGNATTKNTLTAKRRTGNPPGEWSSSMAIGSDPDDSEYWHTTAFYSEWNANAPKLYKQVDGGKHVTDEIYHDETMNLPEGTTWGGLAADGDKDLLYGAQNGGVPKLFRLNLTNGDHKEWERGKNLRPSDSDDKVFKEGTINPDLFVARDHKVYFSIAYDSKTHIYRFDPTQNVTERALTIEGAGSANLFDNYGVAYHNGDVYFGKYSGELYRAKLDTPLAIARNAIARSEQVSGGAVQNNQIGPKTDYSGWAITDLASCSRPNAGVKG